MFLLRMLNVVDIMLKPPDTTVFRKLAFYVCRFFWPPYGKQAFEVIQKPRELEVSNHTQLATHAGLLSSIMILFFFWYHLRKMYKRVSEHCTKYESM